MKTYISFISLSLSIFTYIFFIFNNLISTELTIRTVNGDETIELNEIKSIIFKSNNEILDAELDSFIQVQMTQHSIPGLSACIVKEGQIVWQSAYGIANFETNSPVTLETEFTLASISKLFTATVCAQLWEDGVLDIDEDINNYLPITVINPNFPNIPITVRQLLQHRSSLHDYESDLQLWDNIGDPLIDLSTFCESYFVIGGELYDPDNFGNTAPGESNYWYSNAGFTLLGYIAEAVSETPFNELCREKILTPLQMTTAAWFYTNIDTTDLAMPYNNNFEPYGYYSVPEYPAAMLKANVIELANIFDYIHSIWNIQWKYSIDQLFNTSNYGS